MRNALLPFLVLAAVTASACSEPYRATVVLEVAPAPAGAPAGAKLDPARVAAEITSLSTVREAAMRYHFQHWETYRGQTVEQVARILQPRVTAEVDRETSLIHLQVVHDDPRLAPRIANAVAAVYVEKLKAQTAVSQGNRQPPMAAARERSDSYLAQADALLAAEGVSPTTLPLHIDAAGETYRTLRARIDEEEIRRLEEQPLYEAIVRARSQGEGALPALLDDPRLAARPEILETSAELAAARRSLQHLQSYLGPQSAQIIAAMDKVERLEEKERLLKKSSLDKLEQTHRDRDTLLANLRSRLESVEEELDRLGALQRAATDLEEKAVQVLEDARGTVGAAANPGRREVPLRVVDWAQVP